MSKVLFTRAVRLVLGKKQQKKQKQKQRPDCAMLKLPVELILCISEMLPRDSQLILSQTCYPLRAIVKHHLDVHDATSDLDRNQRLKLLACLAREKPERWACRGCERLHRVTKSVIKKQAPACSRGTSPFGRPACYLGHHHVQLALKYSRMGDGKTRYRRRLQSLLAPQRQVTSAVWPMGFTTHFSAYAKIVGGRYLLFSTWRFDRTSLEKPIWRKALGEVAICPHQYHRGTVAEWQLFFRIPDAPGFALHRALGGACLAEDGVEVHGSCPRCLTDLSAQAAEERVVLRAWQDLGPEGPCLGPGWKLYAAEGRDAREPGSVRAVYYEGEVKN